MMFAIAVLFTTAAYAQAAPIPFMDDFSTNQGWQLTGPWQRGSATAFVQSGGGPLCSEPGTDHTAATTDNMILGDTIGGTYATSDTNVYWATSPILDCASATSVRLRFWRWLGLYDSQAKIEVTNNGSTWVTVWAS